MHPAQLSIILVILFVGTLQAQIKIQEIHYHPPADRDDLQYIELVNTAEQEIDLSGWQFTKGIKWTFPPSSVLAPKALAVIAANPQSLQEHYGTMFQVFGPWTGRLKHGGETLTLTDAQGKTVETLAYGDSFPWPVSPDGMGCSLERIHLDSPAAWPENWAPSDCPEMEVSAGTPGQPNQRNQQGFPPVIDQVMLIPEWPRQDQPIRIQARVKSSQPLSEVWVRWSRVSASGESDPQNTSMLRSSRGAEDQYEATLPGLSEGEIMRVRILARNNQGHLRSVPNEHDSIPTYSLGCFIPDPSATIPVAKIILNGKRERGKYHRQQRSTGELEPTRGSNSLVFFPDPNRIPILFDYIRLTPRNAGWKIRFPKDHTLDGMKTLNLLFEESPRQVLSEPLSYEIYDLAGVPTPKRDHFRVWMNGKPLGYHLMVEQVNEGFLKRHGRNPDGPLYKLIWYGDTLEERFEKKNLMMDSHGSLVQLIRGLHRSSDENRWPFLKANFKVDQWVAYYVVNQCISNWDGFFNNYFLYQDPDQQGLWEIFPWDEDKTWGDFDGASSQYDWYTMPLTFGMRGDRPPRGGFFSRNTRNFGPRGPYGGPSWWRPGGEFAEPMLSDPTFRKEFLNRLRKFCSEQFSEDIVFPMIQALENRLRNEVMHRAQIFGENPDNALREFQANLDSLRNQVKNRRAYLLDQLD